MYKSHVHHVHHLDMLLVLPLIRIITVTWIILGIHSLTHSVRTELFPYRGHRGEFHTEVIERRVYTQVTWTILGTHSLTNSHPRWLI